jgi:hypothetical protein
MDDFVTTPFFLGESLIPVSISDSFFNKVLAVIDQGQGAVEVEDDDVFHGCITLNLISGTLHGLMLSASESPIFIRVAPKSGSCIALI